MLIFLLIQQEEGEPLPHVNSSFTLHFQKAYKMNAQWISRVSSQKEVNIFKLKLASKICTKIYSELNNILTNTL
jgi:hypothetical protein